DGLDDRCGCEHACLHGAHIEIVEYRVDLRIDEFDGNTVHTPHPDRVLRRECGQRAGTKHAQRRKGLEVGLDTGAATRVGAGDRQRNGRRHRTRSFRWVSSALRISATAAAGSAAAMTAPITATPVAPAARHSGTRAASTPPRAYTGGAPGCRASA